MGGGPGGYGGGYNAGMGGGGRQIYVSNVCSPISNPDAELQDQKIVDIWHQLPYNVGWQDLKDLFRQAGKTPVLFIRDHPLEPPLSSGVCLER